MEGPKVIGHGKLVNASTGLHTTGVLLQVRLDVVSMGILSLSTSTGQDKHCWAFVC